MWKLLICCYFLILNIEGKQLNPQFDQTRSRLTYAPFVNAATKSYLKERGGASAVEEETEILSNPNIPSQQLFVILSCILAANSGFLNGLTLSGILGGRQQSVSAVTEAYTASALAFGDWNGRFYFSQIRLIMSYIAGSCLNGLINPNGIDWSKSQFSLLLCGIFVLIGSLYYTSSEWLLCFFVMANGLQNSWTSMLLKENILRTTHFSAATSDIGTFLGQIIRGNWDNFWKLKIFTGLALSFWTGGYLSVIAIQTWEEVSLLVSVALYFILYISSCRFESLEEDIREISGNENLTPTENKSKKAKKVPIVTLKQIDSKRRR
mmetsp:Transcript_18130/g.20923  ORF Transcript_18130/g.20923 Transcript_18130/m.20923 type:complete len:322 (-) Transcript_18130:26-991(-)